MSRTYFDHELQELHNDLIRMSGLIEEAISKAVKSLEGSDRLIAREVVDNDKKIDDMESSIEAQCLRLILRQQPVAKDLRAISTAIKMITDMERIGDQAADIAELSTRLSVGIVLPDLIAQMARLAVSMVSSSIQAFVEEDLELARFVMAQDDEVDRLFGCVKKDVVVALKNSDGSDGDDSVNLLMIAKYLERIGDHAVNISEWVEFYETGMRKDRQIL